MARRKTIPINCYKCGRFLGPDGNPDVVFDDYSGGYECGYPMCGDCIKKEIERRNETTGAR